MVKPRVVVISIDGFAAFYWDDPQARLPTLRRLAERGVRAAAMETVFPSTTWPTHVSMVTGVSPRSHGVVPSVRTGHAPFAIRPTSTSRTKVNEFDRGAALPATLERYATISRYASFIRDMGGDRLPQPRIVATGGSGR